MAQSITIYGAGYVGLVSGACFAELGYSVLIVDVDDQKIAKLKEKQIPFYEPGLEALVHKTIASGCLRFTTDIEEAVNYGEFQFIAVGTPSAEDGSADLSYVYAVAEQIGRYRKAGDCIVVDKSTVPVGTAEKNHAIIQETQAKYGNVFNFHVVSNPEFLREGNAIEDFLKADRVVIGSTSEDALQKMQTLYQPLEKQGVPVLLMDVRSAELTKYAANAMLSTKVSFINEISQIAERTGANIEAIRKGIGLDHRIGMEFIQPGCGYGGSCFPKDVRALTRTAKSEGYTPHLLAAVEAINVQQKNWLFEKINEFFQGDLAGRTLAIWGLSFKPNTDDMREATSRVLLEALWEKNVVVHVYDPVAMPTAKRIYGERSDLIYCDSPEHALVGVQGLAIVTEWDVFKKFDPAKIKANLESPVIFDGRNIYSLPIMRELGMTYYSVGRKRV